MGFSGQPFPDDVARAINLLLFVRVNSYYQKISYGRLRLIKDTELRVSITNGPDQYPWGYGDFNVQAAKDFVSDVFAQALYDYPSTNFQDKVVLLILNTFSSVMDGRGAMCLVPGVVLNPLEDLPKNQELFIGPPLSTDPPPYDRRHAFFIDDDYTFQTYYDDDERRIRFESGEDQFIRGLSIFSRDAPLSCAVHDIIHALKRLSPGLPSFPGARGRAVPCLYNNFLQIYWFSGDSGVDRSIYCAPYIGWWDNTGDHLHPKKPRSFFSGDPYGVCSFTKLRLDFIPSAHIYDVDEGENDLQLAPLAVTQLPAQSGGQPNLVAKVPVSNNGNEYLLVEYRRPVPQTPDDITVNLDGLVGRSEDDPDAVNPPEHLVSDDGILVYHVNEEKSQLGRDPGNIDITSSPLLIRDFVLYLYTPSMMNGDGTLNWSGRTKVTLKSVAFKPQVQPTDPVFYVRYPQYSVRIDVWSKDDTSADITVTKSPIS